MNTVFLVEYEFKDDYRFHVINKKIIMASDCEKSLRESFEKAWPNTEYQVRMGERDD